MDIDLRLSDAKVYDKWYLERIEIVDLQKKERFNFTCYDWIMRVDDQDKKNIKLTVSEEGQFLRFVHLLSSHIRIQVYDEYMWGSLLTRQMPSNFTRVQRLSCCAAMLCLAMIVNAMFYETEDRVQSTKTVEIGSQSLSFGTVYIALISSLVTLPVSITMVTLFKKSRRDFKISPTTNNEFADRESPESANVPRSMASRCYRIIAWVLVFTSSVVSTFFVILYSLEWGPEKSKRWLIAELTSLISSAALVEPFKAILFAVIFATFLKLRKKPFVLEADDVYRQGKIMTNASTGHE
ncbi:polycystin family receptor for egg jelly-like [Ptychodera flava]|uniref:polycystin family receptor for egg jelly-like n=1 Tax=Ptychodera flava TaxID=63121 RepID=UPI00396A4924